MDAERLLAEERVGWDELNDVLASIPPDRFEEPSLTEEGWSAKDVVFHVSAWLGEAGLHLEQMRDGKFDADDDPSRETIEEMNRAWFEASRQMQASDVREGLAVARARMLSAWAELAEKTSDAWSWVDESGPRHYKKHVKDLRGWIGRGGP